MTYPHGMTPRATTARIPTAAGLVGAVVFFGVGWLAALQVLDTLPPNTPATYFPLTVALIGMWQGWRVMGAGLGRGRGLALSHGLRCSVQIAFLGLVLFSGRAVFLRAWDLRYDGLGEAVVALLDQFIVYLLQSLTMPVWGVLLAGGVFGGLICEAAARRWR